MSFTACNIGNNPVSNPVIESSYSINNDIVDRGTEIIISTVTENLFSLINIKLVFNRILNEDVAYKIA